MPGEGPSHRVVRAAKTGGPPAVITAGIGVGATGVAGQGIEAQTDPVASGVAQTVGAAPRSGPVLLLVAAVLILVVALAVPGLFKDRPA